MFIYNIGFQEGTKIKLEFLPTSPFIHPRMDRPWEKLPKANVWHPATPRQAVRHMDIPWRQNYTDAEETATSSRAESFAMRFFLCFLSTCIPGQYGIG